MYQNYMLDQQLNNMETPFRHPYGAFGTIPKPRPTPAAKAPGFVQCVSQGADEISSSLLRPIGLGGSNIARGAISGPFSTAATDMALMLGQGSAVEAGAATTMQALPSVAKAASNISSNPGVTVYPYITTLAESPVTRTLEIPLKQWAVSLSGFFEKTLPISFAVDASVTGFVAVGCAAFNE